MQANTVHCAKAWGYCGEFSGTLVAILPTGSCQRFLPKDLANQSFQINHTKSIFSNGSCQLGKCDPQPAVTQSGSGVTWDITSCCIISHGMTSSASDPLGPAHHLHQNCTVRGSLNSGQSSGGSLIFIEHKTAPLSPHLLINTEQHT